MKKIKLVTSCMLFVVFLSSCKKNYTCVCTQLDSSEPATYYKDLKSYRKERSKNFCENHSDIYTTCKLQ